MPLGLQADLGGLSGDIRALQDQSQSLGTKIVKYEYVFHGAAGCFEGNGDNNDMGCGMAPRNTIAGKEMGEIVLKLRLRAVSRTRDY
mmetsp:Transcript_59265/g.70719  ORF Transcript_59265/g.70719 Transcript_59265/m.70719 type:complete len:87 (-) Transcript_59265:121-381(-)